jgi:glycosyltransferase involved in cell wall biosynthesis
VTPGPDVNVLQVNPSFFPATIYGGTIESGLHLSRALADRGCSVRVLTTDANGRRSVLDVEKGRDVEVLGSLRVRYCRRIAGHTVSPELLGALPAYVRWADVVHLTAVYSFPIIPTLAACRAAGRPVVWSPRGALQRWSGSTRLAAKALWERACRAASPRRLVLHATSEDEAVESAGRIPGVATAVVPNGVELPDALAEPGAASRLRLVFLGRLHAKKGIENLLDACALLERESDLDWALTVACAGDPEYARSIGERVARLSLSPRVSLAGEVTGAAKSDLLRGADLVVVPSHTENFGIVVAEALAHGVPVVASRGTPWRRVEEVGCGLWVENDPRTLAEAVLRMSRGPLGEAGRRGRSWMEREFAWDARAREMIDVYDGLLRQSR